MDTRYRPIEGLLMRIEEPNYSRCLQLLEEHRDRFEDAWGSTHNHQNWPGGYLEHVEEVMNIASALYHTLDSCRPLPFSLSDAMLILFLHDIEKPWRFEYDPGGERTQVPSLETKKQRQEFREKLLKQYDFNLTPEQLNGLTYVEGEYKEYSSKRRVMNELAAFCHLCDVTSARIYHSYPSNDDPWKKSAL